MQVAVAHRWRKRVLAGYSAILGRPSRALVCLVMMPPLREGLGAPTRAACCADLRAIEHPAAAGPACLGPDKAQGRLDRRADHQHRPERRRHRASISKGIIPPGTDSHTFEPSPGDARKLAGADLIVVNGLSLEGTTIELAQANMKPGARILELGPNTLTRDQWMFDFSFPEKHGDPNPHVWMNPIYALHYAELVRDALAELDAPNADLLPARTPSCSARGSTRSTRRSWRPSRRSPRRTASC